MSKLNLREIEKPLIELIADTKRRFTNTDNDPIIANWEQILTLIREIRRLKAALDLSKMTCACDGVEIPEIHEPHCIYGKWAKALAESEVCDE